MLKAAICDDSARDAEYVRSIVSRWAQLRALPLHCELFPSAESFLFRYDEDKDWDILLLDIEMGRMDGVSMAKAVRRYNEAVQIIFVTGYSDYIAEGYEVAALHYLMKPVSEEKLYSVLDRAYDRRRLQERCLRIDSGGEMLLIPFYEIRYLDVRQNYVTVHAAKEHTVKRSLADFEKELDERFFRAGRSMIVNLSCIRRVSRRELYLSDGSVLPLPRGAYEALNRAIIERT